MKRTFILRSALVICASASMMMCNSEDGQEEASQEAKQEDPGVLAKSFSGKVVDANNTPIVGATVMINGIARTTSSTGQYAMSVPDNGMGYHLEVQKNGYAPLSDLYFDNKISSVHKLVAGNTQTIDPTKSNKVLDRNSGIEVTLAANALSTTTGAPPAGLVRFTIVPLSSQNMPGDLTAVTTSGAKVALDTIGAVALQAEDSQGRTLGLAASAGMTVKIPVPASSGGTMPSCVLNRRCTAAMWKFDRTRSLWVQQAQVSAVFASTGTTATVPAVGRPPEVDGLGVWNSDIMKDSPACTIVHWVVDLACYGTSGTFSARAKQYPSGGPVENGYDKTIDQNVMVSVLYNLWPWTDTKIELSGTPCTATFVSPYPFTPGTNSVLFNSGQEWSTAAQAGYPTNSAGTAVLASHAASGDHPCNSELEIWLFP